MSKWLLWTALEFATCLVIANILFLWLSQSLKKRLDAHNIVDTSSIPPPSKEEESHKRLAHYIDRQMNHAVDQLSNIKKTPDADINRVNMLKLWGTILRAERSILLNQASSQPLPILNRFLASLLYAVSSAKLESSNQVELNKSLQEIEQEYIQTAELLITKETLYHNQVLLNEDIKKNIDRAKKHVKQLDIKEKEKRNLKSEIDLLRKQIENLRSKQEAEYDESNKFELKAPQHLPRESSATPPLFKQVATLNKLSERQQIVIEELHNQLERASESKDSNAEEMQTVAVSRLNRMSQESDMLIGQLEQELENTTISIDTLRDDILSKDARLADIERQLAQSSGTAISSLQSLSENKKKTLGSIRDGLNTALEHMPSDNLKAQDEETKVLERLLSESETCVTLLAQELEMAEKNNKELKQQLQKKENAVGTTKENIKSELLITLRETNRILVQETNELKEALMNKVSEDRQQELRTKYNKRSLEYDRLRLACADLERKYLAIQH